MLAARALRANEIVDEGAWKSIGGNDELSISIAAHAIDRAGGASSDGVGVTAGMLCRDGDGAIGAADDGTLVIEGGCGAKRSLNQPYVADCGNNGPCLLSVIAIGRWRLNCVCNGRNFLTLLGIPLVVHKFAKNYGCFQVVLSTAQRMLSRV
jgi:hypothetical protein